MIHAALNLDEIPIFELERRASSIGCDSPKKRREPAKRPNRITTHDDNAITNGLGKLEHEKNGETDET